MTQALEGIVATNRASMQPNTTDHRGEGRIPRHRSFPCPISTAGPKQMAILLQAVKPSFATGIRCIRSRPNCKSALGRQRSPWESCSARRSIR